MKLTDSQLKMLVLGSNLIPYEKLSLAEKDAKDKNIPLLDILPSMGLISSEQLGRIVADALKYDFVSLKKVRIDKEVMDVVPEAIAKAKGLIAFEKNDAGVKVGMADPDDLEMIHILEKRFDCDVIPFFVTRDDIDLALSKYRGSMDQEFGDVLKKLKDPLITAEQKDELMISAVDLLLQFGYQSKSSDIHIEPHELKVYVRFRIDGVLHDVLEFPKEILDFILSRIKILAKMRTDEHRKAQDGKLRIVSGSDSIDIRVSIIPTINGEKAVMRVLSSQKTQFSLTDLGLSDEYFKVLLKAIKNPHGMILVTGPTGSGKTTTIYGVMKVLNKRDVNIASIEDPVEYNIEGINQVQVNEKAGITFAKGLRALVRQDPDIIMIGEIRDEETASIAVNSALTGHLVLSTLHTNNAATTIPRLLDMGIEPFLAASTVNIAIGQRLVRQICTKCRVSYQPSEDDLRVINNEPAIKEIFKIEGYESLEKIRFYKGLGCEVCGKTGFQSRIGIFEIMEVDEKLREMIVKRESSDALQEAAKANGMITMMHDGIQKVIKGMTTLMEVYRVTRE